MRYLSMLFVISMVGCGGTTGEMDDMAVPADLVMRPDQAVGHDLAPGADQARPADLAMAADQAAPRDLALPADLALPSDLAVPSDLAIPSDLALPADLAVAADLVVLPDLAKPDIAAGPDIAMPGDLATPPDLATPSDLTKMVTLTVNNYLNWCDITVAGKNYVASVPPPTMYPAGTVVNVSGDTTNAQFFVWAYWKGTDGDLGPGHDKAKVTKVTLNADATICACCPLNGQTTCAMPCD
jgi:hypothetical protein